MGLILGAMGGLGEGLAGLAQDAIKQENSVNLENLRSENDMNRVKALEVFKREQNARTGQAISEGADQKDRQRIADKINLDNGSTMSEADAAEIAKNPAARKAYGIIDRTRAQEMDDKAGIAEKIGALDHAKDIRGQQQIEISRDQNERRLTADEKRNELEKARLERQTQRDQDWKEIQDAKLSLSEQKLLSALKSSNGEGGGSESAKIKTANVFMEKVNQERKAKGEELLTFEEAYKVSNSAAKDDGELKGRAAIAKDLMRSNPGLADDPEGMKKAIDSIETVVRGDKKPTASNASAGKLEDVRVNGKVIGQARSQAEAKQMYDNYLKSQKK